MRRNLLLVGLLLLPGCVLAQEGQDAIGLVVVLENNAVTTLDVSLPALSTMSDVTRDLQEVTRWTGWSLGRPQVDNSGNATTAHVLVTEPAPVQSALDDVVWPLVAAFARHGRLGLVIMGGQFTAADSVVENQYVRLEQSGGQGVHSYQAQVKDANFGTIEALSRNEASANGQPGQAKRGSLALAWVLVIIAAAATGFAVYTIVGRRQAARQ
ncbi:MAG: hypothetical protein ABFE08_03230 [Armatimonadia bacterium]